MPESARAVTAMSMANIDLFDEFTAGVLAQLYEAFPRKVWLDARVLAGESGSDDFGRVLDPAGNPSARFEIARATIEWLIDTGYLRAAELVQHGAREAVLTPAALLVLKATPASLKASVSTGERLVRLLREGSLALAKETAKAAIASGVGIVTRG